MTTTLEDIRFKTERYIQDSIDSQDVINWCNDAQSDFLLQIDIPDSTTISITPDDLTYPVPTGFKRVGRMWLQSSYDSGVDAPLDRPYRVYNGNIIFFSRFSTADTLNLEFYRHLTYFDDVEDVIDLDDRYSPLYVSYCLAQYYCLPSTINAKGEQLAKREYEKNYGRYLTMKDQIAGFYTMNLTTSQIQGVW